MSGGARGPEVGIRDGAGYDGGRKGRRRLELSGTQVMGAMLATMTGTLFASKLGVLGTVAGAAVMSVASTVGTAVYQYYLRRGGERLRDARHLAETASLRQATRAHRPDTTPQASHPIPATTTDRDAPVQATLPFPDPIHTPPADGDTITTGQDTSEETTHDAGGPGDGERDPSTEHQDPDRHRSWKLYVAMAIGVFALVMGGVTVYEAIVGKPLSAVVNGDKGSGTTLGDLGGGSSATTPPDVGETTVPTPEPDSTGQNDDGSGTETTPRPDASTPSDDATGGDSEGGPGGGDSTDPTPSPSTPEQQTPAPGDDGALGDTPGDGQAPDVVTTPGPAPSAALSIPGG